MAATSRHSVLGAGVGVGGDNTIILDVRQRHEVGALVGSTVERKAVVVAETGLEEVADVVLDGNIRLQVLRVVVNPTVELLRTVEGGTPRTVLNLGLVAIPTHTELVLHLRQAENRLPLQTTVVLNTDALLLRALLGGDQDDTCTSTATIQSGSGSAFQHCHRLDIIGVDCVSTVTKVETTVQTVATESSSIVQGHTINNIQRLVATRERTDATDNNRL